MTDKLSGSDEDGRTIAADQPKNPVATSREEAKSSEDRDNVLETDELDSFSDGRPGDVGSKKNGLGTPTSGGGVTKLSKGEEVDDEDDDETEDDETEEDEEDEEEDDEEEDDEEEDDEEEEEARLKYVRLTPHLGAVYRNGDATSAFMIAGDKMIIGTHNGNIHVIQLPMFQSIRVYHAHSASVTGVSVSPFPPPLPTIRAEIAHSQGLTEQTTRPSSQKSDASPAAKSRRSREPQLIPKTPSNDIYIATSSMDGNVCVQSLIDMKDVHLRNFARPVQAVALSPEYKSDKTYLSGGLAGQLILTVGGGQGRSTSTTIGTAAATASGWLGSMGLSTNNGKDTIIHSGEGAIGAIKWSLSGKYVVWLNEHGIKIMRSSLQLESSDSDDAWKRIGHIDRPQTEEWDTMAGSWKGRVEWIDEQLLEADDSLEHTSTGLVEAAPATPRDQSKGARKRERLLVGWGGTIWSIHVHPEGAKNAKGGRSSAPGRAEIVKILRMDCIISGITLYTQNLLVVLAYCNPDNEDEDHDTKPPTASRKHQSSPSVASTGSPSGGIRRRQNHQPPELRLIDLNSQAEIDKYVLGVSRYERLGSGDYHLGILPASNLASAVVSSRGALEALAGLGTDMWNAAINPKSLFSSAASVKSKDSGDDGGSTSRTGYASGTIRPNRPVLETVHPSLTQPGSKIFLHSPYDCTLATKRDLADHLVWLVERKKYQRAWELLDENPDILSTAAERGEIQANPQNKQRTDADDFFDDDSVADSTQQGQWTAAEREKRRIGDLWLQDLVDSGEWDQAGKISGRVSRTSEQIEKWAWVFIRAKKFDEITDHLPTDIVHPKIAPTVYESVLNHYLQADKLRFKELLDRWSPDLFDANAITTALENQLRYRDVREDSIDDGEKGRNWRIVTESLAHLLDISGRHREALKCFIKLHDADSAFRLIRDNHLAEAVADDIPGFISLRVPQDRFDQMSEEEFQSATSEAINLLVDEAQHGLVRPNDVVDQLRTKKLFLYLHFYFKGLWRGQGLNEHGGEHMDRLIMDSQSLVDEYADLAVQLFARYDPTLLMDFLRSSTSYAFEKAVQECEAYSYYDELVYLYSKTGDVKRALYLIIDRLKKVHKAIEFAKEQDDPDLWEDLLNYSMDKPSFIRGLLEQAGTAINPITLVKRIPEGLEIEGLREGLTHMMKEHEIQYSISSGVARVLRSEVASAQNELRAGQRKGIKFEVVAQSVEHVDVEAKDVPTKPETASKQATEAKKGAGGEASKEAQESASAQQQQQQQQHDHSEPQPGHCARCGEPFTEYETETLVGYVCGHVFHVSHLLEMVDKGRKVDVDLAGGGSGGDRYTVGMKVMRARLLRDKVGGTCPLCHST